MRHHIQILASLLLALLTASCSGHSSPDSPEPDIAIAEATDITRTEATVKATVDSHGGPRLGYVRLHYREVSADPADELTMEGDPTLSAFSFRLTELRPGVSYTCHLEAGTATASLRSEEVTFTTIPNDPPKVSGIMPLSTGPLGITVRFSITDDGGEPIIEAGCEVKEAGGSEGRRIYVLQPVTLPDYMQINITGLTPSTSYVITPFASNSQGESLGEKLEYTTSNSVVLTAPGMLASLFGSDQASDLERLTIAGPMDGDDFRTLRTILGVPSESGITFRVSDIDLTDARIVEGGGSYDGQRFTVSDHLSTGLFAGCSGLRGAILPNSATAIERDAFARCPQLEILTIPAGVEAILPSSGCSGLKAIEVAEPNTYFKSDQGVLLNADATEILWFPCGKTGEYRFPSTISTIGENAFAGTSVTTLIIPASVTSIIRGAFAGSALKEIILPDNLTNISEGMFQNCSSITALRLGTGTDYIGDFAFDGTDLTDLYISAQYPPYTAPEAFTNRMEPLTEKCTLHVPEGTRKIYRNHSKWGAFKTIVEFQP